MKLYILWYSVFMIKIGIIGAMQVETNYLLSIMQNAKQTQIANLVFNEGEINNIQVVLVQSGVGKEVDVAAGNFHHALQFIEAVAIRDHSDLSRGVNGFHCL